MFKSKKDKIGRLLIYKPDRSGEFSDKNWDRYQEIINGANKYYSGGESNINETITFLESERFNQLLEEGHIEINLDYLEELYNSNRYLLAKNLFYYQTKEIEQQMSIAAQKRAEYEQKTIKNAEKRWKKTKDEQAIFVYTDQPLHSKEEILKLPEVLGEIVMGQFDIVGRNSFTANYITRAVESVKANDSLIYHGWVKMNLDCWRRLYKQGDYFLVSYIIERDFKTINEKYNLATNGKENN